MLRPMRGGIAITLVAVAVAIGAGTVGAASAATPCWKAVQNDWYRHGRVVGRYKLTCYTLAVKNLPADAATYGGAAQDIRKAYLAEKKRLAKIAAAKKHKKK
jgi:hypothetical protein